MSSLYNTRANTNTNTNGSKIENEKNTFTNLIIRVIIIVILVTVVLSGVLSGVISSVIYNYREQNLYEWASAGDNAMVRDGFIGSQNNLDIKYMLWIGDLSSTVNILNLVTKNNVSSNSIRHPNAHIEEWEDCNRVDTVIIQPIYIPDPKNTDTRNKHELQITRELRQIIINKYPLTRILPIISINSERPNDTAFNNEYDQLDDIYDGADTNTSDIRLNILRRWAKYYKFTILQPNELLPTTKHSQLQQQLQLQKTNSEILTKTWNCWFPMGINNTPCGLCKQCEKINLL